MELRRKRKFILRIQYYCPYYRAKTIEEVQNRCPSEILQLNRENKYGQIKHETYYSTTCKRDRNFNIFLPASYDNERTYPVLYMLHGIFGNEYSLTGNQNLKIRKLLSNMSSFGLSEEIVVFFPDMYAYSDPDAKPAFDAASVAPYDNFINDLVADHDHITIQSGLFHFLQFAFLKN